MGMNVDKPWRDNASRRFYFDRADYGGQVTYSDDPLTFDCNIRHPACSTSSVNDQPVANHHIAASRNRHCHLPVS